MPGPSDSGEGGATLHELIHAFSGAADEYVKLPYQSPTDFDQQGLKYHHAKGFNLNVSATDDPTKVPWAHFIGHPNYPYVGVYEGAEYLGNGRWRSERKSVLTLHYAADGQYYEYINAICREMTVKRIKKIAGEEYSFEEFVAKDKYEPNYIPSWLY